LLLAIPRIDKGGEKVRLTGNQKSALRTLLRLARERAEDCIPTKDIAGSSRLNVSVGTMRSLERKKLVELCDVHHFKKPFRVLSGDGLEPVEYADVPILKEQGEDIAWLSSTSYGWKLKPEGEKVANGIEKEFKRQSRK
jgi:hypothetical protein